MSVDPVSLEVFKNMFESVAEEMGVALQRTSYSPNIKERRDFSCAIFDPEGNMIAQAAHVPVHLGAMPASVRAALEVFPNALRPGDIVILNDPYLGGTHLPDITMVAPVYAGEDGQRRLAGFVSARGHHADVGGMTPGSLPLSTELYQEGTIIPPIKLARGGRLNHDVIQLICRNSRTPDERKGDLAAQTASIRVGEQRMRDLFERYGFAETSEHMAALLDYSERVTRQTIRDIPDGTYSVLDYMDDDGLTQEQVPVAVTITVTDDEMDIDFTGTSPQRPGCINAPEAVTVSACLYVVRCLLQEQAPANQGCLRPLHINAPVGSLVNPTPQRGVAAGNVETSQRITDVLFGALAQALPQVIPAASQGTMNNNDHWRPRPGAGEALRVLRDHRWRHGGAARQGWDLRYPDPHDQYNEHACGSNGIRFPLAPPPLRPEARVGRRRPLPGRRWRGSRDGVPGPGEGHPHVGASASTSSRLPWRTPRRNGREHASARRCRGGPAGGQGGY